VASYGMGGAAVVSATYCTNFGSAKKARGNSSSGAVSRDIWDCTPRCGPIWLLRATYATARAQQVAQAVVRLREGSASRNADHPNVQTRPEEYEISLRLRVTCRNSSKRKAPAVGGRKNKVCTIVGQKRVRCCNRLASRGQAHHALDGRALGRGSDWRMGTARQLSSRHGEAAQTQAAQGHNGPAAQRKKWQGSKMPWATAAGEACDVAWCLAGAPARARRPRRPIQGHPFALLWRRAAGPPMKRRASLGS